MLISGLHVMRRAHGFRKGVLGSDLGRSAVARTQNGIASRKFSKSRPKAEICEF